MTLVSYLVDFKRKQIIKFKVDLGLIFWNEVKHGKRSHNNRY